LKVSFHKTWIVLHL